MSSCSSSEEELAVKPFEFDSPAVPSGYSLALDLPPWSRPGAAVTVRVRTTTSMASSVDIQFGSESTTVQTVVDGDVAVGTATFTPESSEDVLVTARGEGLEVSALLHVTDAPCEPGQRFVGGQCVSATDGTLIGPAREYDAKPDGSPRDMVHPRNVRRVGGNLVGCHTDAVAIIPIDQPTDDDTTVRYEALMAGVGLEACEHFVMHRERGVAVASSRGTAGLPGGLSLWRLPEPLETATEPMENLFVWTHDGGVEGIVRSGDYVFGARNGDPGLGVYCIGDTEITECGEYNLDPTSSPWAVALDGDRLYLTDLAEPPHDHPAGQGPHDHGGGALRIFDVSDPTQPVALGVGATFGPGRSVAVLPEKVVAVAAGGDGIELFDVSDEMTPRLIHKTPTGSSAMGLWYQDGLLALADWSSVRIYDAGTRGTLRPLDAFDAHGHWTDLTHEDVGEPGQFVGLNGSAFVRLQGDEVLMTDIDRVVVSTIRPGAEAPRSLMLDTLDYIGAPPEEPKVIPIRFESAGRRSLRVTLPEQEHVESDQAELVLPPGERGVYEVRLTGFPDGATHMPIFFETNEPTGGLHQYDVLLVTDHYQQGQDMPRFAMPALDCSSGSCVVSNECSSSDEEALKGRPVVYAFFSSW